MTGVHPRFRLASVLTLAVGFALALGCGPQNKFCPDSGDGICRAPVEASVPDIYEAPPMEMGSIYVGADSGTTD